MSRIAKAIGVSYQQVQKYENGTNRMSASAIPVLADFFNVSPMYFFNTLDEIGRPPVAATGKDRMPTGAEISERLQDPKVRDLIHQLVAEISR